MPAAVCWRLPFGVHWRGAVGARPERVPGPARLGLAGIFSFWPTLILVVDRLLADSIALTVVPCDLGNLGQRVAGFDDVSFPACRGGAGRVGTRARPRCRRSGCATRREGQFLPDFQFGRLDVRIRRFKRLERHALGLGNFAQRITLHHGIFRPGGFRRRYWRRGYNRRRIG